MMNILASRHTIYTLALALGLAMLAPGCSSGPAASTCTDGTQSGDETGIDCGGACGPCDDGLACVTPGDCESQVCESGQCAAARCGDRVVNQASEQCDDGNASNNDDCLDTCISATCGDGIVWNMGSGTEQCDDGNASNNDDCLDTCISASCGDGHVWDQGSGTEQCDDGNMSDGDDCTAICEFADCADGIHNNDEIDVDCGGHCGPRSCWPGQVCTGDSDCASNSCVAGVCETRATIVTAALHTCALLDTGAVRCWGYNNNGQLGYGHTSPIGDDELPSSAGDVSVGGAAVQLAGADHTCALLDTGAVRCWGRNHEGQLGYGHTSHIGDDELPSSAGDVSMGGVAVQITAGDYHTCALFQTGVVRCWGFNTFGQLGYGHTSTIGDDELPSSTGTVDVGGYVVQITAGSSHTCALLQTGAVRCWGRNNFGQLGYGHTGNIGDNEPPSSAGDVDVGDTVVQIAAGGSHTCALLQAGTVRCWGRNFGGELGYGHTAHIGDDELPASAGDVDVGGAAIQVIANIEHTCALLAGGAMRCWGSNPDGQLGYGHILTIGDDELPSSAGDVAVGGQVVEMAPGLGFHTCARLTTGGVRCWGYNGWGGLGYGHNSTIGDDELPSSAGDVPYN